MKQLTCEMCGSTDLIKDGGFFVCQTCGTKYSVEEAKKMMIEGTVEVTGSVKIDTTDNLEKLYNLAQRAREDNDTKSAAKYYEMILIEKPQDWEAAFFSLYYSSQNCTLAQMEDKLYTYAAGLNSKFQLIEDIEDESERNLAYDTVYFKTIQLIEFFSSNISHRSEGYSDASIARQKLQSGVEACCNVEITLGDLFIVPANNIPRAITIYKMAEKLAAAGRLISCRDTAIQRIKTYDPEYEAQTQISGGCYVATCVYGSYDCPQVWTLRRFRDDTLGSTWYGRLFIRAYYAVSPTLVKWFGKTNWFKKLWRGKLDRMVTKLQKNGVEDTPYEDKKW